MDRHKELQEVRNRSIAKGKSFYKSDGKPDYDYFDFRDCPVCKGDDCDVLYENDSGFRFVRCQLCEMVYMNPALKKEYAEDTYIDSKGFTAKHERWEKAVKNLIPAERPERSDRYDLLLKHAKGGILLDFDCGFGKMADKLKFYFDTIEGVEIDRFCANHARKIFGFTVYTDFIETLNFENKYDAILSYNSIEHVYHPKAVLKYLFRALKSGGVIYIECPNIKSLSIKVFAAKHHLLQSNEHLNMFDLGTIKNLLEDVGFLVVEGKTRKFDVLTNDLIVYLLKRECFYHRCSGRILGNSVMYDRLIKISDKILNKMFSILNNQVCCFGLYIQVIAQKI
jgi:2-polyprenyl-3-methyl-5-hydroxy-6-metoxy-1,4-benzoquinol methylase